MIGHDMPSLIFDKVGFTFVHYESCATGIGFPPSESQLSGILQMQFLVCNDIGTSVYVFSTKLVGSFEVI